MQAIGTIEKFRKIIEYLKHFFVAFHFSACRYTFNRIFQYKFRSMFLNAKIHYGSIWN